MSGNWFASLLGWEMTQKEKDMAGSRNRGDKTVSLRGMARKKAKVLWGGGLSPAPKAVKDAGSARNGTVNVESRGREKVE